MSFETISIMIAEIIYGGRVTDKYDFRIINCLIQSELVSLQELKRVDPEEYKFGNII